MVSEDYEYESDEDEDESEDKLLTMLNVFAFIICVGVCLIGVALAITYVVVFGHIQVL